MEVGVGMELAGGEHVNLAVVGGKDERQPGQLRIEAGVVGDDRVPSRTLWQCRLLPHSACEIKCKLVVVCESEQKGRR